jgi:hypothetical protein
MDITYQNVWMSGVWEGQGEHWTKAFNQVYLLAAIHRKIYNVEYFVKPMLGRRPKNYRFCSSNSNNSPTVFQFNFRLYANE